MKAKTSVTPKAAAKKAVAKKVVKKKTARASDAKGAAPRTAKSAKAAAAADAAASAPEIWHLRLYVAGQTPRSLTAFANLKKLCAEHLPEQHEIEVVDLLKQPHLAQSDGIVALPTLVRKLPAPLRRVIGDLSNVEKVLVGIDLRPIKKE